MAIKADMGKSNVSEREDMEIFREVMMRYGIFDLDTAREILNRKIKGKLSDTVLEMREEE